MSKNPSILSTVFWLVALAIILAAQAHAKEIDISISVHTIANPRARVIGTFRSADARKNPRNLAFVDEYAGRNGLAGRITNIGLLDIHGVPLGFRLFAPGEVVTTADIARFSYDLDLKPPAANEAGVHLSWLTDTSGILMMHDLLPGLGGESATIKLDVPSGWTIRTTEEQLPSGSYRVAKPDDAVFYIGTDMRTLTKAVGQSILVTTVSGEWRFADGEASDMAASVFREYERMIGPVQKTEYHVRILRYPVPSRWGNWEADTRGSSITIFSADMPFKAQSLQLLHEQLRHEVFHLWIPNGLNLTGRYDWFYEGFALYQSLKLGLSVNRIRFDDYLDTLSRAYNLDVSQTPRLSLVDAAKSRWSGGNSQIYARGLLVAFLCDLAMLAKSGGKRSVTDLLSDIYARHHDAAPTDGTATVIGMLSKDKELTLIVERYITGSASIEWAGLLADAGLEATIADQIVRLKPVANPSGRQKNLLDKLGYNNWRRLRTVRND